MPDPAPRPAQPKPANTAPATDPAPQAEGSFVDEDYTYGSSSSSLSATPGFRDLDRSVTASQPYDYDDGFGETSRSLADDTGDQSTIPPLDAAPEPAPAAPKPAPKPAAPKPAAPAATGNPANDELLLQAVIGEGAGGRYEALSLDGGFRGRFGPGDPYHQRAHDGLRFGPHQAAQDTGELGELLLLMRAADGPGFAQTFGPDAEEMQAVVTAEGPSGLEVGGGRGPRVQPVAGRDLWEDPWIDRFRAAARHGPFQAAMRAQILARRLDPLKPVAQALGIDNDRGIAMLMALAIQRGVEGAEKHLRAAVNPFDTPARLGAALDALGYSDLGAFRASAGLPPGDTVDPATHFALLSALRQLGPDSPVQVPDGEGVMDALVTAAGPGSLGDALLKLRVSPAFGEVPGE